MTFEMPRVRNIVNTTGRRCAHGDWLSHYDDLSGTTRAVCSTYGCGADARVGGHVEYLDGNDRGHYIVPLCFACNSHLDEYELKLRITRVPANTRETGCGYR